MKKDITFAEMMGILFIAIGFFAFLLIVIKSGSSPSGQTMDSLPDGTNQSATYNKWIVGAVALLVNCFIGTLLFVLGKIQSALEVMSKKE